VAPGGDKFACAAWSDLWPGAPRVIDPLVAFACRLTRSQMIMKNYETPHNLNLC
jgi:flavin reductase (DIM6/NTAB) family NADH-FMN oxidoreductase RutF